MRSAGGQEGGREGMAPLFVRIPAEQARRLDVASFERGRPKQALVAELVERYLDVGPGPQGRRRRFTVESVEPDEMAVGRHSFRPYEEAEEVLLAEEAGELLKVDVELVVELAQAGELPGRKLGGEWRFARSALLAWLSQAAGEEGPGGGAGVDDATVGKTCP